jgi:hypothetical protein
MSETLHVTQLLTDIALAGLLGMVGQVVRSIAGLKKMNDQAQDVNAALFSVARLVISLIIGFVAGVCAMFALGLSKFNSFDSGSTQTLLGIASAGYVGTDFIEAFFMSGFGATARSRVSDALGEEQPGALEDETRDASAMEPHAPQPVTRFSKIVGAISVFGGPDDHDMRPDEGLALFDESDASLHPDLFLSAQPANTTGLARRLNPAAAYIACRWDYRETSRRYLRDTKVTVTNPRNGRVAQAQPVDWGPNEWTKRTADLSPGLAETLGLKTNEICEVAIPLPATASPTRPISPAPLKQHLKVMTVPQIEANFGRFTYDDSGENVGAISITDKNWLQNIVERDFDQLKALPPHGTVRCHIAIADKLAAALAEIEKAGLLSRILIWDGMWVPRHKGWNPSRSLSSHSWGIAFDINAKWNGYGANPAPAGQYGSVEELVPIFEAHGFAWGGFFSKKYRDGMHFEYALPAEGGTANIS